jgi:hypothetical protein
VLATPTQYAFIIKPEEVKQLAHRGRKRGPHFVLAQTQSVDADKFREAWGRTGRGDISCFDDWDFVFQANAITN